MKNYVAYHVHDDDSLLDSCTKYKDYVDKAVEFGQTAIAITNHGNIYNWLERKIYAESKGIKMLMGMECYVTENPCDGTETTRCRDNYHTILIAKNPDGEKEICRLFDTSSKPDHFYYDNRISMTELFNISDNVYKISACLASPLNRIRKDESKAALLDKLLKMYDYYEIQPHDDESQAEYNQWLYEMSKKYHKPLIAATDTHAISKYKSECTTILKLAKKILTTAEDTFDLTYKSYDELYEMFEKQNALPKDVWLEAINNTNIMAESVIPSVVDHSVKYPNLYGDKTLNVLKKRINSMYKDKVKRNIISDTKVWRDRIKEELDVFEKVDYVGFILFMSEMAEWCWDNGIPIGYCRGSVGGSAIAYILDIIDVNAIKWNTVFSRFCNVTRAKTEVGDIDIDISPSQRGLVQQYIIDRFGTDNTAYVLSIGTIAELGCIGEIGRAFANKWEMSHGRDIRKSDKLSPDNPYSPTNIAQIKAEYNANPEAAKAKYPDFFYYLDGLIGTNVSQSMHPAGVIAAPLSLTDNYGTFWNEGKHILALNMEECHELQLAKYDCLGLKNIEIIKDCCELAGIPYPKSHLVNWEDKDVWDHIVDSPVGIFQFEGDYAFDLLRRYKPRMITHLSTINASLRPSGQSYRDKLIAHEKCINPSPMIDELLKDNDGWLIFQEDTIKFLTDICGLDGAEADNVRRAIGRKQMDRLQEALPKILDGYCRMSPQPRDVAEKEAQQFLKIIEDSANYQFGYNHSTGYSMIGYTCAYLRYYYPTEFIAAYLQNAKDDEDTIRGTALAKQLGIKIESVKFRYSQAKYTCDGANRVIYKPVSSLKDFGSDIANKLYALKDNHYDAFIDFLKDNPCGEYTAKLIKLDFFSEFGKSQYLLDVFELFQKYGQRKQIYKSDCDIPNEIMVKYANETAKMYKIFDNAGLLAELSASIPNKSIPVTDLLETQAKFLGYLDYINPKAKGYGYVLNVDTKYSPKINLYCLDTGDTITVKLSKRDYNDNPFKENTIIVYKTEQRNKSRKVDGKWIKSLEEFEPWITNYKILK